MNNPNCGACGMLNSRGFCTLTACRFPVVNELGTLQERILANKPKQTNGDRIRSMTDEELARILPEGCHGTIECPHCCSEYTGEIKSCTECWLDWLKQEVDE